MCSCCLDVNPRRLRLKTREQKCTGSQTVGVHGPGSSFSLSLLCYFGHDSCDLLSNSRTTDPQNMNCNCFGSMVQCLVCAKQFFGHRPISVSELAAARHRRFSSGHRGCAIVHVDAAPSQALVLAAVRGCSGGSAVGSSAVPGNEFEVRRNGNWKSTFSKKNSLEHGVRLPDHVVRVPTVQSVFSQSKFHLVGVGRARNQKEEAVQLVVCCWWWAPSKVQVRGHLGVQCARFSSGSIR